MFRFYKGNARVRSSDFVLELHVNYLHYDSHCQPKDQIFSHVVNISNEKAIMFSLCLFSLNHFNSILDVS